MAENEKRQRKPRGRSKGEGSVFERKDLLPSGRKRQKPWVAQITVDGKLKPIGYFKTETEAIAARNKALRALEQGTWVDSSKQTMGAYLEYWLEHVHKPAIGITTYENYRLALHNRIIPALGYIQVQKLTVRHVQMFYSDLLTNKGLAASYVRYVHAILHVAMEHAVREGLISRNICHGVKLPRSEKREQQVLSMEQAARFWSDVENEKMKMILMLAVTTTLRRGEVLALKWQDIDIEKRLLHVRRNLVFVRKQGLIEKEPKTEHSRRKITLPQFIVQALERYRVTQQDALLRAGSLWVEHDLVFCNRYGAHIHLTNLDRDFAKLLEAVGMPKMRFHDLRHSAVTILLKMGVPAHVVQEIAGHSDVRTTLDIYGHVLPGQQEEAMNKWDHELGSSEREQRADLQLQWSGYSDTTRAWLEILAERYGEDAAHLAINAIKNL